MIRTINNTPGRDHYVYQFAHQDMLLKAYDEIAHNLKRLRLEIHLKYKAMAEDKMKYVYYKELIPNLERQFCSMVLEGIKGGSIIIIAAGSQYADYVERKVA